VSAKNPAFWIATFSGQADRHVEDRQQPAGHRRVRPRLRGRPEAPQIADSLKDEGILDGTEVAAFMRRHPDKTRLAELRQAVADKLKAIEALKNELMTLKAELAGSGG
jgi:hypothetical protein